VAGIVKTDQAWDTARRMAGPHDQCTGICPDLVRTLALLAGAILPAVWVLGIVLALSAGASVLGAPAPDTSAEGASSSDEIAPGSAPASAPSGSAPGSGPPPGYPMPPGGTPPGGTSPGGMPPGYPAPPSGMPPGYPAPPSGMPPGYPAMPGSGSPYGMPGQQAAPKSNLPADVSEWRKDQYYQARREGDPRLKDAVKYLGKTFSIKRTKDLKRVEQAGTLLTRLLKAEQPKAEGPTGAAAGSSPMPYPGMPMGSMPPGSGSGAMSGSSGSMPGAGGDPGDLSPGSTAPSGMMPGYSMPYGGMMGAAGQVRPLDPVTIKAIVDALAVNGGTTAKQTIREVLAGTFKSDSDRAATQAALETLVKYPTPESEEVLFKAITTPDLIRPKAKGEAKGGVGSLLNIAGAMGGQGQAAAPKAAPPTPAGSSPDAISSGVEADAGMPPGSSPGAYPGPYGAMSSVGYPGAMGMGQDKVGPAELQMLALALVRPTAKEPFRLKVASSLAEKKTAEEFRPLLSRLLLEPDPENLAGQFVLLGSEAIADDAKTTIGGYLTTYSSQALCALLGIPTNALVGSRQQGGQGPGGMIPGMMPGSSPGSYPGGSEGMRMIPPGSMPGSQPPMGPSAPDAASSSDELPGAAAAAPSTMMMPADGTMPGSAAYPGMTPGAYPGATPGGPGYPGMMPGYGMGAGAAQGPSLIDFAKKFADDPELCCRVGRQLWGGEFVGRVIEQLDGVDSLEHAGPQILLASTIPTDAVRQRLFAVLNEHWKEGPAALEAAGLADTVVSDPGFLAVIKSLPRKDAEQQRPTRLQRYRARQGGAGAAQGAEGYGGGAAGQPKTSLGRLGQSKRAKGGAAGQAPGAESDALLGALGLPGKAKPGEEPDHPEYLWMDTCQAVVRAMCQQYHAAAKKGKPVDEASRPIEVPATANVVAEYHFNWPEDLADQGGLNGVSLDSMKVHYLRLEQSTTPTKVFAYFKLRMMRPTEHPAESGYWMESFRSMGDRKRRLSVDILVTRKDEELPEKKQAVGAMGAAGPAAGMPYAMPGSGSTPKSMPGSRGAAKMMPGAGSSSDAAGPYGAGQPGAPGQTGLAALRARADKDQSGDLIVEILTVEVNNPAPVAEKEPAEEGPEKGGSDRPAGKGTVIE